MQKRQHEGAANGTINRELGFLRGMFRLGFEHTPQLVVRVPNIPQLKKNSIRSGYFEHDDFIALRAALPDYAQVAITLAYYSGMRMGEVCSLQWPQINWIQGKLYLQLRIRRRVHLDYCHRRPGSSASGVENSL
jgi:integrase